MTPVASAVTTLLSLLTIGMQVGIVLVLVLLILNRNSKIIIAISRHAIALALAVASFSVLASLYYSEIVGFVPCTFCWYQRAILFPQVFILAYALWRHSSRAMNYTLTLSVGGFFLGLYQYYGQMFDASALPCPAGELVSSCATRYFLEFGYITIPMMSLTAFAALVVILMIGKFARVDYK